MISQLIANINKRIQYLQTLPKHDDEQVNKIRLAEIFHLRKHIELINKLQEEDKEIKNTNKLKRGRVYYTNTQDGYIFVEDENGKYIRVEDLDQETK